MILSDHDGGWRERRASIDKVATAKAVGLTADL
jgi:hypothetical protein